VLSFGLVIFLIRIKRCKNCCMVLYFPQVFSNFLKMQIFGKITPLLVVVVYLESVFADSSVGKK
jgi:hypothetical protein